MIYCGKYYQTAPSLSTMLALEDCENYSMAHLPFAQKENYSEFKLPHKVLKT